MKQFFLLLFSIAIIGSFSQNLSALDVDSASLYEDDWIPVEFAYSYIPGGKNKSLNVVWDNAPAGTKSFAILMWDKNKVAKEWVHWLVINIPANVDEIPENASKKSMPSGAVELLNSFKEKGYGGPGPPEGTGRHDYVIEVYALNVSRLSISGQVSRKDFLNAIKGKVIKKGSVTGYFEQE